MDHRGLARLYAFALVLVLVLGGLTAAWMRIELATLDVHSSSAFYWRVFSTHALACSFGVAPLAISATIGHLVLPDLLARPRLALLPLAHAALLATLLGTVLLLMQATPLRHGLLSPLGVLLLGLGALGMGLPLFATISTRERARLLDAPLALGLSIVGLGQIFGGVMALALGLGAFGEAALNWAAPPMTWLEFSGLALISQVMLGDSPPRGWARVALGLALLALGLAALLDWLEPSLAALGLLARPEGPSSSASMALGFVGGAALVLAWTHLLRSRPLPEGPTRSFVGLFVLMFGLRSLLAIYVATLSLDVHLHDTYVVFGLAHLRALMTLLLALPAGLLWCWPRLGLARTPSAGWWTSAAWVSGLALSCFVILATMLGHQGMPRRYLAYLPEYWPMQFALSLVTIPLLLGPLIWALDLARAAWARPE